MGIRFACHACQKPLHIKAELAGKRGVCPQCGTRFRIPSDGAAQSTAVEETEAIDPAQYGSASVPAAAIPTASAAAAPAAASSPSSHSASSTATRSLLDDPTAVWYVRPPSGGQYGPATGDVLRTWIAEARVTATSLVWRDGWPQWRSAAEALIEFGAGAPAQATPLQTSPAPRARAASSVPAAPALAGDATIGARKSRITNRRILIVGGLAALSVTLIGILFYLIQQN
ncbi:MAG: GYF domain-containing protein [Planctomycetaceae bacterium]